MTEDRATGGRRERAKEDKRRRIVASAQRLFAEHGVGGVTTQQIADEADVAIGTLFLYAATKAELLIMVQNRKFAEAVDRGLVAATSTEASRASTGDALLSLVDPIVRCIREHPENGRTYLHELVFGDATEPFRRDGLALSLRLEAGLAGILARDDGLRHTDADTLARVVTSVIHVTTTATIHLDETPTEILGHIRRQIDAILPHTAREPRDPRLSGANGAA